MGIAIAKLVKNGLKLAKSLAPDVIVQATVQHYSTSPVYNTATGTVPAPDQSATVPCILGTMKVERAGNNEVRAGDKRGVIDRNDLIAEGVQAIDQNDRVTVGSTIYAIVSAELDPTGQAYIIHFRLAAQ